MGENSLTQSKYIQLAILLIVLIAWFSSNSVPNITITDNDSKPTRKAVPVNLQVLGINSIIPGGTCNLEYINDAPIGENVINIKNGQQLKMSGWVIDKENSRIPDYVIANLKSETGIDYYYLTPTGLSRPDVVKHFGLPPNLIHSGFVLDLSKVDLPHCKYSVTLILPFDDINLRCDNGRIFRID